ncbi:MAG: tryptophan--tRNA ligase [Oscillospiraceae bacterium]|nr:tryptophan--tRNA ligase [Oscillospiraceae bacterium]
MLDLKDKKILLTGDRPSGKLHLGHYVGSLKNRVKFQENKNYQQFVFLADLQALTDHAKDPQKIINSVTEVTLDYLSVGLDPSKTVLFIQSQIPELCELNMYFLNLVTISRLQRNPTVKEELKHKSFGESIPAGFLTYPVSQAADITAFKANYVPVGEDQLPLIEQTREIVRSFNNIYGKTLIEPEALLSENDVCKRLPGIDGKNKMSKTLGNAIYISDEPDVIKSKVMSMFTDPDHIKISDPGKIENNAVFIYLDAFCQDQEKLLELKEHYQRGGLGDIKVKQYLNEILQEELRPIRERRKELEKNKDYLYEVLKKGSEIARSVASKTLFEVKDAMGLNYNK